jgi:uncharacterized membrane protein
METKLLRKSTMKKLLDYFLQGMLYIAPLGITFYVIYLVFKKIDGLVLPYIEHFTKIHIPGLGLILLFFSIALVGYLGQKIVARPIKITIEKLLARAPIIQVVYTSIRDFLSAFVGKEKKFTQPVLVKVNKISDLEKIGFLTATDLSDLNIKNKVAVYFPHSYNFSGELFIVPSDQVIPLDISPAEAMKFIVSGGVSKL